MTERTTELVPGTQMPTKSDAGSKSPSEQRKSKSSANVQQDEGLKNIDRELFMKPNTIEDQNI